MSSGSGSRLVANIVQGVDDPRRFGNKLRAAREGQGLSQIELGEMTGYSNGWISSVERGAATPTGTFARRMEVVLRADLGVTDLLRYLSNCRRGDVGNWGMTPTEMSGYVGLSRTRVYDLLKVYTENRVAIDARDCGGFDFGVGYVRWVAVDNWQRIEISECARFVVWEGLGRPRDSVVAGVAGVAGVEADIRNWLDRRRSNPGRGEVGVVKPEMGVE